MVVLFQIKKPKIQAPPPPPPPHRKDYDKPIEYLCRRESKFQVISLTKPFLNHKIFSPWKDGWYTRHTMTLEVGGVRKRHSGMSR